MTSVRRKFLPDEDGERSGRNVEYKNLCYGISFGLLGGAGAGAVLWGVTGNPIGVAAGAGVGLLAGTVLGALLDCWGDRRP